MIYTVEIKFCLRLIVCMYCIAPASHTVFSNMCDECFMYGATKQIIKGNNWDNTTIFLSKNWSLVQIGINIEKLPTNHWTIWYWEKKINILFETVHRQVSGQSTRCSHKLRNKKKEIKRKNCICSILLFIVTNLCASIISHCVELNIKKLNKTIIQTYLQSNINLNKKV